MKKRTVKDFTAMYAEEEQEKLALIRGGVSASRSCLDKYWTASVDALALAGPASGEIVSGECCLNWPLTDKEQKDSAYHERFAEGVIYRVKVRPLKRTSDGSKPWYYVTDVTEQGVSCPELEAVWADYIKPVIIEDEVLGTLTLDKELGMFNGRCLWLGKEIAVSLLDVNENNKGSWTRARNAAKKLFAEQEKWDSQLREFAAGELTALANEWLADDEEAGRDPKKEPITREEFAGRLAFSELSVYPGGRFTAWYDDGGMFWGHVVTVDGSLKKGPRQADIEG